MANIPAGKLNRRNATPYDYARFQLTNIAIAYQKLRQNSTFMAVHGRHNHEYTQAVLALQDQVNTVFTDLGSKDGGPGYTAMLQGWIEQGASHYHRYTRSWNSQHANEVLYSLLQQKIKPTNEKSSLINNSEGGLDPTHARRLRR